ncbi:L-histidine N(alpha)-methyltransferase [uncultured Maricaulis sp.]|uniref:L-histidine N(alpha)-methyltransferase n=1 Tax=uncultured Maricaulis sp. TaxID=174710 RepID=UPI0030D85CD6
MSDDPIGEIYSSASFLDDGHQEFRHGSAFYEDHIFVSIILDMNSTHMRMMEEILQTIQDENRIDQKFLYIEPVSVQKWNRLISCDEYNTYRDCLSALERFTRSEFWIDYAKKNSLRNIVDLGVGAGIKDYEIIKSLHEIHDRDAIHFVLLDTSFPMLETTILDIRKKNNDQTYSKRTSGVPHANLIIRAIRTDFLHLNRCQHLLRAADSPVAFFMLGCTFSNLSEAQFVRSLLSATKAGDLFVVGVDLYDSSQKESSIERLKAEYNHSQLYDLASIPINSYLRGHASKLDGSVQVSVEPGVLHSDVRDALTVTISTKINDQLIRLAASSRYMETSLIQFIQEFGFTYRYKQVSPRNPNYVQIAFERN